MIEAWLKADKLECAEIFNMLLVTEAQSRNMGGMYINGDADNGMEVEVYENEIDGKCKYEMDEKRWASLYNREGAEKLKMAMMKYLYHKKFGHEVMESAGVCD